jgi:hypothetical protein
MLWREAGAGLICGWRRPGLGLGLGVLGVLLGLGCAKKDEGVWSGVQTCSVGVPPENGDLLVVPPSQSALSGTRFIRTGDGFSLRDFTLGPIGSFSCTAPLVTAHFVTGPSNPLEDLAGAGGASGSASPLLGSQAPIPEGPALAQQRHTIALDPFSCFASDGRIYALDGKGESDLRSAFFSQSFSAWFRADQATLLCTTTFTQETSATAVPDAGIEAFPAADGGNGVVLDTPSEADGTGANAAALDAGSGSDGADVGGAATP